MPAITTPTCIPFQRRYPAHPTSVSRVRKAITNAANHGILGLAVQDPDLADAIRLLASELVTNAITHTASEADDLIEVTLWTADDHLWLAVADTSADPPVLREPNDTSTSGRGLLLVSALAMTWGVIPRMAGVGKVVFAGLRLP
jgi:anti-sigma regulatory factor (Ser/Thr protein kinase)